MTSLDMQPTIILRSGRWISFEDPQPEQFTIEDIAYGLANECRYGCQIPFYSVAEHSVRVSRLCDTVEERKWGLLHDSPEGLGLRDLPSPLKRLIADHNPVYKFLERKMMIAVCKKFGLPLEEPAVVTAADRIMLVTEARDLCHPNWDWRQLGVEPLIERIENPWPPHRAAEIFLNRFHELFGFDQVYMI